MQPDNKPTPMQKDFEEFIAKQSLAIQEAYAQIKPGINWRGGCLVYHIVMSVLVANLTDLDYLFSEYCERQTERAQVDFEQLIARQSDELQVYYAQLKAMHKIEWQYGSGVGSVLKQAIADNNLAFIKLFLTQYNWAKYYELDLGSILSQSIQCNHLEIFLLCFSEFNWQNFITPKRLMDDTVGTFGTLCHILELIAENGYYASYSEESCITARNFFISNFAHNPQMFGYDDANKLVADFCRFFQYPPYAMESLVVMCGELNTVAARDFLRLLADNINNIDNTNQYVAGLYTVEELQKLHVVINETLTIMDQNFAAATLAHRNIVTQNQLLQQKSKATQTAGNQTGVGITHAMKQLERIIFNLLSANEASPAMRERLLGQFLVTHAAILKQCLDQYSASHQNFATNPAALESIIAHSQETGEPQFIVLDSCAAFNPDSRAILIVTPCAANQEQAWYFSPVGAAMPAAVQGVVEKWQLQVNIINNAAVLPNQVATAMAAQQKPGQ